MLSEKIALISHTLEVDSPCERIVPESAAVDAHKDTESDPSLQLHSAVHSRNSPTQTHVQEDLQILQESHIDHVHTNAPHDSTQRTDSPTTHNSPSPIGDLPVSDTHITQEIADDPPPLPPQGSRGHTEGKQFATRLPKLEIPVFQN